MNYEIINISDFEKDLIYFRNKKTIQLYFDLETYQYNENQGYKKPSYFKNMIYSLGVGYFKNDVLRIILFNNFKPFFDTIFETYSKWKTNPKIELIAHNNNKYDNHYLRNEIIEFYNLPFTNQFLTNAVDDGNLFSLKIKDITDKEKFDGLILEKRIKSKNNLELLFYKNNIQFNTVDNYMKTNSSLANLGLKLRKLNLITDDELKTDYDYILYNKDDDMTKEQARKYAKEIFDNLSKDELHYIRNDIVILAYGVKYYNKIYKGFDWNNITLTKNILDSYNTNNLTSYQLLNKIGKGKNTLQLKYTDYKFNNQNLFDYLKEFYNGGLNFYNYKYIGQIIDDKVFGIDINSSYPYVMYKEKIPTYLKDFKEFDTPEPVNISEIENQKDTYTLYRISRQQFDDKIILKIRSQVIKQLLVKYYGRHESININSYTLKMIKEITGLEIKELNVFSYITFDCILFGSRDKIKEYYQVKTQGQNPKKLNMDDLYNIFETDAENKNVYSIEEIDASKLHLNGLYGIPALRPAFNLFRYQGTQYNNIRNGFLNSERNIVFSVFVTSVSLYNLLEPLKYMTSKEIDENFLYCDTDSLYFKESVFKNLPKNLFDKNNLGKWDIQNKEIDKFYILNHKKYALLENGKITVKAGGIRQNAFNLNQDFNTFIKNEFSDGVEIKNIKSIYNKELNLSLYESVTKLELGKPYNTFSYDPNFKDLQNKLINEVHQDNEEHGDDGLYIESNIGSYSISDFYPVINEVESKRPINYLIIKEKFIKEKI